MTLKDKASLNKSEPSKSKDEKEKCFFNKRALVAFMAHKLLKLVGHGYQDMSRA